MVGTGLFLVLFDIYPIVPYAPALLDSQAISVYRFLEVQDSLMRMNEAILACRFLKVEGSYMRVFTVLEAIVPFNLALLRTCRLKLLHSL